MSTETTRDEAGDHDNDGDHARDEGEGERQQEAIDCHGSVSNQSPGKVRPINNGSGDECHDQNIEEDGGIPVNLNVSCPMVGSYGEDRVESLHPEENCPKLDRPLECGEGEDDMLAVDSSSMSFQVRMSGQFHQDAAPFIEFEEAGYTAHDGGNKPKPEPRSRGPDNAKDGTDVSVPCWGRGCVGGACGTQIYLDLVVLVCTYLS